MAAGLKIRHGLLNKIETTIGTDALPTPASDYVRTTDGTLPVPKDSPIFIENNFHSGSMSKFSDTYIGKETSLEFELPFRGNGNSAAGNSLNPIEADAIIRAAGFAVTYQPESVPAAADGYIEYTPATINLSTMTVYAYIATAGTGSILTKMVGCVVESLEIGMDANGFLMLRGTLKGIVTSVADIAYPAFTVRYPSVKNIPMVSSTWLLDSYAGGSIKTTKININNTVAAIESHQAATGISEYQITARTIDFTFDAITPTLATYNYKSKLESESLLNLSLSVGATNNKVTITPPALQYKDVQFIEDQGLNRVTVSAQFKRLNGDDEIKIRIH